MRARGDDRRLGPRASAGACSGRKGRGGPLRPAPGGAAGGRASGDAGPRSRVPRRGASAARPVELRRRARDRGRRRSRSALRLLGGDRARHRARARRPRSRRAGSLARPPRVRHDRTPLRWDERAQLLRSPGRARGPAVVLRHRQADLHRRRRGRHEVVGGVLRPHRALGPGGLPAQGAGAMERAGVDDRARLRRGEARQRRTPARRSRRPSRPSRPGSCGRAARR